MTNFYNSDFFKSPFFATNDFFETKFFDGRFGTKEPDEAKHEGKPKKRRKKKAD